MPISVGVIGATGKLGSSILEELLLDHRLILDGAYTHPKSTKIKGIIRSDLENSKASIWIEASLPESLPKTLSLAVEKKIPLVIGTTGINPEMLGCIKDASQEIPILHTPNFSFGMVLLFQSAKMIAPHLKSSDITIIETHRKAKKDAPSGSALFLASQMEPNVKAAIHSIRAKEVIAELELRIELDGEKLSFCHSIRSRKAFAKGALDACIFLLSKSPGLYSMLDMIYSD